MPKLHNTHILLNTEHQRIAIGEVHGAHVADHVDRTEEFLSVLVALAPEGIATSFPLEGNRTLIVTTSIVKHEPDHQIEPSNQLDLFEGAAEVTDAQEVAT